MASMNVFTLCVVVFALAICIEEISGKGGSRGSSSRSSGSRGSSSSSRGSSSSSRGSSSSSSSRGSSSSQSKPKPIQPSPARKPTFQSSSKPRQIPTARTQTYNRVTAKPTPRSYGQAAQPYTPRPNQYNQQNQQNSWNGQPTPRSYGQPAQPYTPGPNQYNHGNSWNGQPTPRSYGQPAQPYTQRPNQYNQYNQQNGWNGQPTPRSNVGWQQGQVPNPNQPHTGLYPGTPNHPNTPYWQHNSNSYQQVPSWQNNGLQPGRPLYPQQQRPTWQMGNTQNYGMQPGQPQWGQGWNSNPSQTWHQPAGQPIIINNIPQTGVSSSSFQQKFQTVANIMTMYNFYHNIKSSMNPRPNYGGPGYGGPGYGGPGYGGPGYGGPGYGSSGYGGSGYRPGQDPYYRPGQQENNPHGHDQYYSNWNDPVNNNTGNNNSTWVQNGTQTSIGDMPLPNDNETRYSHHWFPEPTNFYSDIYNYSENSIAVYDSSQDGCCSGTVFSSKESRKRNCCGTKDFDPTFHACCGGKTHYKRTDFTCCGNEYYNYEESLCCFKPMEGPTIVRLPFNIRTDAAQRERTTCCGEQLIDIETHVCCGAQKQTSYTFASFPKMYDNDTRCCYGRIINGKTDICENIPPPDAVIKESIDANPYPEAVGMCANELYNPRHKICCTVYNYTSQVLTYTQFLANKTSETAACCGNSIFDTKTELCCEGNVHGNSTGRSCCGSSLYNVTTEWCCTGTNLTIPSNATEAQDKCCGEEMTPYSSTKQMCCGSSVLDIPNLNETHRFGCCNTMIKGVAKTYDRYTEVCCDGVVHKINGTFQQECCGTELIDMSSSFCCSGQVSPKIAFTACCDNKIIYNMTTHICCNAQSVARQSRQHTSCCGHLPYAEETEICCYNPMTGVAMVEPRRSPWMQCCDTTPFDEVTQTCCENEVIDKNGTSLCCLQFDPFIPRMSYAVVNKTNPNNYCCGLKVFDATNELCCNLTVLATTGSPDERCCGSAMYRMDRELCCNGIVQQKKYTESACCGDKVYNVKADICCGNVIKWKGAKQNATCCFPGMEDF